MKKYHLHFFALDNLYLLQIIAKSKGLIWKDYKRLGDVQSTLGLSLEEALTVVKELFHPEPYTKEEVCEILGVTPDELAQTTLSANTLTGNCNCPKSLRNDNRKPT